MSVRDGHITNHKIIESVINFFLTNCFLRKEEMRNNLFFRVLNTRQKNYLERIGVPSDKIFNIPEFVDTKKYCIATSYGKKLNVVHIGGEAKNAQVIIDTIKELIDKRQITKFKFFFIGKHQPKELFEYAEKTDSVVYLGALSDTKKIKILSMSDVQVVPNPDENFAVSMIEGLSSGLRLVVSNQNPIVKNLIKEGALAYTCSNNPSAYAKVLLGLARMKRTEPYKFQKLKMTNRAIAIKEFEQTKVFNQIKDMFIRVASAID